MTQESWREKSQPEAIPSIGALVSYTEPKVEILLFIENITSIEQTAWYTLSFGYTALTQTNWKSAKILTVGRAN